MENKSAAPVAQVLVPAVSEIRSLLEASRKNVAQQVNQELLSTYWKIGEVVVRCEQNDSIRAAYGEKTLSQLSRALTKELGKGFSRSNVYNMRQFYLSYPIFQTVSGKLSWSHYCELLSISDKEKRSFYEKEAVNSGWSVRELRRQMESSLFERLLLSRGDANKEQVLALAEKVWTTQSRRTLSRTRMYSSFWDCRKKSRSLKAIWKQHWCDKSKISCWNLAGALCLSAHSSVSQ